MPENSFIIDNDMKNAGSLRQLSTNISFPGSPYKSTFYNILGHPLSKVAWTNLLDSDNILLDKKLSTYYD